MMSVRVTTLALRVVSRRVFCGLEHNFTVSKDHLGARFLFFFSSSSGCRFTRHDHLPDVIIGQFLVEPKLISELVESSI